MQWVGAVTDIDESKRSKEALQEANDQLGRRVLERTSELCAAKEAAESANRAKSEFLANMSHEIRTPLNGIIGITDLVLETEIGSQQREYLDMLKTSGQVLLGLVNDILDLSKTEAGKLELEVIQFNLRECVSATLIPLTLRAQKKGLELRTHIADDVEQLLIGDSIRLRQILLNWQRLSPKRLASCRTPMPRRPLRILLAANNVVNRALATEFIPILMVCPASLTCLPCCSSKSKPVRDIF